MKILLFGASGKLGKLITKQALDRGCNVTAFTRDSGEITSNHPNLVVCEGDIYKPETVASALEDQDVVISALGRKGFKAPLICRDGIKAILPAMERHKLRRLIAVSAFGASEHRTFSLYTRLLRLVINIHMRDKDEMEKIIKSSAVDWTIIRPAAYLDSWPQKNYALEQTLKGLYPVITRIAVATCILDQLENQEAKQKTIAIRADS